MKVITLLSLFIPLLCAADVGTDLDKFLSPLVTAGGPGLSVAVLRKGEPVFEKSYGLRRRSEKLAISVDTRFELASVSKQMTAMAIMILKDQGKLDFDMPVTRFLPELKLAKNVTLRQLLHHTAGLPDYMGLCKLGRSIRNTDVISWLATQSTPDFIAGEKYDYSNTGYAMLASVAERASGLSYPELMRKQIFEPLGMSGTFVNQWKLPEGPEIARAYGNGPNFKPMIDPEIIDCNTVYGDGSVYSSVRDMARWSRAIDNRLLVRPETFAEAFVSGKTSAGESISYGFGWRLEPVEGLTAMFHSGGWGGFHNHYLRLPDRDLALIILSNYEDMPQERIVKKVIQLYGPT